MKIKYLEWKVSVQLCPEGTVTQDGYESKHSSPSLYDNVSEVDCKETLKLHKNRDEFDKLFRGDMIDHGNKVFESVQTNQFIDSIQNR